MTAIYPYAGKQDANLINYVALYELKNLVMKNATFFILSVTYNQDNILTLKTTVSGDFLSILNSNRLKCCITHCGDAG